MRQVFGDNFFYILYFQEPGVADADLGRDPRDHDAPHARGSAVARGGRVRSVPRPAAPTTGAASSTGIAEADTLPDWLTQEELDHYVAEFARTGFTGGINWYRNFDRNWALTEHLDGAKVTVPSLFIGGSADPVLRMTPARRRWTDGSPIIAARCSSTAPATGSSRRSPTRSTPRCSASSDNSNSRHRRRSAQ